MTTTSCLVSFGSNAIAIKEDATFSTTSLNTIGNLDDLKNNTTATKPYVTYEPNFWLLDGNYKFAPDSNELGGYISAVMSPATANTNFTSPPKIEANFSELHSTDKITLNFSDFTGDYSSTVMITFYNGASVISSNLYYPTSTHYTLSITVANFNKIEVYFYSQNKAYRYARLNSIEFDEVVSFSGSQIKSCKLVEQIDPVSVTMPYNQIDMVIYSDNSDFNIVDPQGFYASLQNKEPLYVYEVLNNVVILIGKFYVENWKSESDNLMSIRATCPIGLLEEIPYDGGLWDAVVIAAYYPVVISSEDLINEIMTTAGLDYEIDPSLEGIVIEGYLPATNCRDALRQACFRIGAYASASRSKIIRIIPITLASDITTADVEITASDRGIETSTELLPLVTGIEVMAHDYHLDSGTNNEILYDNYLDLGPHKIVWGDGQIIWNWENTGTTTAETDYGSFPSYNVLYLNVITAGMFSIERFYGFIDLKKLFYIYDDVGDVRQNIITVNDATLIDLDNASGTVDRLHEYYSQRYLQKTKLFSYNIAVGNSVLSTFQNGREMKGIVEKTEIDLAKGFISNINLIGIIVPE